jgi:hypothetical protein
MESNETHGGSISDNMKLGTKTSDSGLLIIMFCLSVYLIITGSEIECTIPPDTHILGVEGHFTHRIANIRAWVHSPYIGSRFVVQ